MSFRIPGRILGGTVTVPDLRASVEDYCSILGLELVDEEVVSDALAVHWGAPAHGGRGMAVLGAPGGAGGLLRLVEGERVEGYRPLATYGWAAFEFTVADAFALRARIDESRFHVLGEPKLVPGFDTFIPFQVAGRAGEVLYLNQVLKPAAGDLDLPRAGAMVDHMFIAVLASADRGAALAFHTAMLGFEEGETHRFPYSMINRSFGLDPDHATTITMTRTGRIPATEIDQYPDRATPRARRPGALPPGNAMVTFAVADLDAVRAPLIAPPRAFDGPFHAGQRAATVWGPDGEVIELVEVGA